jgi:hypothetical protein
MSRRFSDEPINLIHRIPTPEQLASARPTKRSFSQAIIDTVVSYVRSAVDAIVGGSRVDRSPQAMACGDSLSQDRLDECAGEPVPDSPVPSDAEATEPAMAAQLIETAAASPVREEVTVPPSASMPVVVQQEEVAELRAYLLSQQQDIVHLSAQIHELKSLVVSQQQVLLYLGKELEAGAVSSLTEGVASAAPKRNRPVRQKPIMKDKAVVRQEDDPKRSSLGLWPGSTHRPDL